MGWGTDIFPELYEKKERLSKAEEVRRKNARPSSTPGRNGTTHSYSGSSKSVDPDDYDIEAYYEDRRDLYDSYEDAEEGFLEDKSSWGDYG